MKQGFFQCLAGVSLGVVMVGLASPASAAASGDQGTGATATPDPAEVGPKEITVTAQRRNQRLQDVPVSVSAISSADMRALNVTQSKDISKAVPGVLLDSTSGGGFSTNLTIRGISQSDFSSVQESPNSTYIDDVYLSSPDSTAFTLYDLQRVEVLRGPQGTLFGRASSGGLANFISNKSTHDFTAYAEGGFGNYNDGYVEGAISGPISDKVRFRLSGRRETSDGWFLNGMPGGTASFQKNFYGIRLQLEADVTPTLTARLSVSYDADPTHREGTYRAAPAYIVNGQPAVLPANVDAYGTGPGNDFVGYRDPYPQFNKADFNSNDGYFRNHRFSPTLYLTQDLGNGATLNSITNYTRFGYDYGEDDDGGPVEFALGTGGQKLNQWSQELRLNGKSGRLTYSAGGYYLGTQQTDYITFAFPGETGTPFGLSSVNDMSQTLRSLAVFGQLEYKLADTLTATVGARYTNEHKQFSSQTYFDELGSAYGGPGISNPPLLAYDFSKATVGNLAVQNEGLGSGKIGLDYKPDRTMLFYASVSRGVKGAGFNTNSGGGLTIAQTPFKSEYVYAYEGGAKLDLLDRKLRINTSVFYYDYHRFQGFAFSGVQGVVGNYNGRFSGGEMEIVATPRGDIDLNLSASTITTRLYDISTAYSGIRSEQSIMAPPWTANGSVTKRITLPFGILSINWNGNYIDHRYASIDNNAATYVPGSFVHNARVSLALTQQKIELAFFVDNISNVARQQFSFDLTTSTGSWLQSYAPPRMFGGSIRKSF